MRHDRAKYLLLTLCISVLIPGIMANAQENPAVQVDMSVLNAMQPAGDTSSYYSKPVLTRARSQSKATAPDNSRYHQQPETVKQPVNAPFVSFPVTIRDRSEVTDPSLEKADPSSAAMIAQEEANKAAPVINPPLPLLKPVAIAARKPVAPIKIEEVKEVKVKIEETNNVPLPPRRPSLQQASASFVSKAQKHIMPMENGLKKSDIAMPAVPPQTVDSEPLQALYTTAPPTINTDSNDLLARKLVEPDKKEMIKGIEAVAALTAALTPSTVSARRSVQTQVARIPAAPVPPEKPNVETPVTKRVERITDITAITPAAGIETTASGDITDITEPAAIMGKNSERRYIAQEDQKLKPEDFISLPFPAGASDLDNETTGIINRDIVSRLKNNPSWRLQVQSFAEDSGRELKSARRQSLSRALSVRSYLLDQGIESRRIDVRALGMETDRTPIDRVDFVFLDPQISN